MPSPSGHLLGTRRSERPKNTELQHPGSAIWPRYAMSASGGEKKGGSSYSQTGDANNVGILYTGGVGPIPISQYKRGIEIVRGRA
jgi:hypothetical protein